jgi:hypothetical protein
MQQTKKLDQQMSATKPGTTEAYYEKGQPREAYTIPFNKQAVDKLLEGKTPFGPDSINITDPAAVQFVVKITGILGVPNFRCGAFTYEQFIE